MAKNFQVYTLECYFVNEYKQYDQNSIVNL